MAGEARERQVTPAGTRPNTRPDLPPTLAEGLGDTRDALAEAAGVSHGTIDKVRVVLRDGPQSLVAAARDGDVTTADAFEVMRALRGVPDEERRYVVVRDALQLRGRGEPLRVHVETAAKPHVAFATGDPEWYTPPAVIEAVRRVLGDIDLDPASCAQTNMTVGAARYYTVEDDGLAQPWAGRVFLNPPFAQPTVAHFAAGDVTAGVLFINNSTETAWAQTILERASAACFPLGRLRLARPDGSFSGPLQGQMIAYLGPDVGRFAEIFGSFGGVLVPWRMAELDPPAAHGGRGGGSAMSAAADIAPKQRRSEGRDLLAFGTEDARP